jgi:hypothetical protein
MLLPRVTALIVGAALLATASSSMSEAQQGERRWELLGEKTVGFLVDRDVIALDQDEGWYKEKRYRRLRLSVDRNDIHLNGIRLVYFNKYAEDIKVDRTIRENDEYLLRLDGDRGFVRRIELSYRSRPSFEGRARVKVYGQPVRYRDRDDVVAIEKDRDRDDVVVEKDRDRDDVVVAEKDRDRDDVVVEKDRDRDDVIAVEKDRDQDDRADGNRWIELGCRRVSSGRDRDTIEVGNREGWFRAIRLSAEGNDVELLNVEVVYGNGAPDELDVRRVLRDGDRSRPFDLKGGERTIERIELVYRQRGRARVCAEGLLAG